MSVDAQANHEAKLRLRQLLTEGVQIEPLFGIPDDYKGVRTITGQNDEGIYCERADGMGSFLPVGCSRTHGLILVEITPPTFRIGMASQHNPDAEPHWIVYRVVD